MGIYLSGDRVSRFFAGLANGSDRGEVSTASRRGRTMTTKRDVRLLPDTILPTARRWTRSARRRGR